MKRLIALFLVLVTLFSLASCQTVSFETGEETETETETKQNQTVPQTTEEKPAVNYPKVYKPITWDEINSIPVATDAMTEDELRKICVDFFRMQQTFRWTPDEQIDYNIATFNKNVTLPMGKVYGGAPYVTGATGNLYIAMDYYDPATGVLKVSKVGGKNIAYIIGNQCSYGSFWGWARVVNSTTHSLTNTINEAHGCLKVGPYTYDTTVEKWSTSFTTTEVCQKNGKEIMFQSYAAMKPGDGIVYYTTAGHVQMISEVHVEYNSDNTIDGKNSYARIIDQGASWANTTMEDGSVVSVQGGVDSKSTFEKLYNGSYVPFTFAELRGTDPVEKAEASINLDTATPTVTQLSTASVSCNYAISHLTISIFDAQGNLAFERYLQPSGMNKKSVDLKGAMTMTVISYANKGGHSIKISCRAGTGEALTVVDCALTK